ncbi:MAG: methyltransferase regulatory domain-containing protein [Alphaproteobacteria bacterium]|nr:methyltransferase regulatory domain-containing protein [Alphaproteobacteria bacterium]
MKISSTYSPTTLRFIAALRGKKPLKTGESFVYAEAACADPQNLICLAASNPEGQFYGLVANENARVAAEKSASEREALNVAFIAGSLSEILENGGDTQQRLPQLDYLCCNETGASISESERTALFDLAKKHLKDGGLFVTTYCAYADETDALRFLVQQLAPEMNSEQKLDFLSELKKLGYLYFQTHLKEADLLDRASYDKKPEDFFTHFDDGPSKTMAFETLVAAGSRGFAYAGDTEMALNFVELSIPAEAQELISSCRKNPYYEIIKDFALNRKIRSDIWVKTPYETSLDPADLMGAFAYGLIVPRDKVPSEYFAKGRKIDLSTPLFDEVLGLISIMPLGVGDLLRKNPSCDPQRFLEVFQILVACGFALPMRGATEPLKVHDVMKPRFVGTYNKHFDKAELGGNEVLFASRIAGCGITLDAKEALVMQALNRRDLVTSATALMPELFRISETPARESILGDAEPSAKLAQSIISDTVGKSLPTWYAYAILEAA